MMFFGFALLMGLLFGLPGVLIVFATVLITRR
jgi:hypothetical protein